MKMQFLLYDDNVLYMLYVGKDALSVFVCPSQRGLWELVESGRYDTHSNFTVVLQPFFRDVVIPLLEVRCIFPRILLIYKRSSDFLENECVHILNASPASASL